MPAGFPEWPGPCDAEEGETYTRQEPGGTGTKFDVQQITEQENGAILIRGRYFE